MEEKIVIVLNEMSEYLSITQMKKLQEVIIKTFADNEASKVEISNEEFLKMFLDAKRIEGCSERTIIYYQATVKHLLSQITTEVRKITTEEIREYLSKYQKWNNCSNVTIEYMGDIGSNGANKVIVNHLDMKDEEDYAMMVRFTNFTKNDFEDDVKFVSKEAYDFFKKSQIFGGELIICKIGSAGQNYVMPYLDRPVSLGLNQIMVRIKDIILMPYLYQYLHTDYGELLISGCINGAVTKTITKTELKKIPVMLPPMELQKKFVDFVIQVDKSKVVA